MTNGEWEYLPSCPCSRCEQHRTEHGMTNLYGVGYRPTDDETPHQYWRQG